MIKGIVALDFLLIIGQPKNAHRILKAGIVQSRLQKKLIASPVCFYSAVSKVNPQKNTYVGIGWTVFEKCTIPRCRPELHIRL